MLLKRTDYCGNLRMTDVEKSVVLNGWVKKVRDFGKFIFIDLWDHSGIVQIVCDMENENLKDAKSVVFGDSVGVKGVVVERQNKNDKLPTGEIEVVAEVFVKYSSSPAYPLTENASDETRLKYRYLDIRTERMQRNLRMRHKFIKAIRDFLDEEEFIEVETPILSKSTPEGARDYLVPSRIQPGMFYALPQSPQIYKQLLMIGGVDKYFQIAKSFRDEDLRANRQPEFTQLDMELSYVDEEDIFSLMERMLKKVIEKSFGKKISTPFERMPYIDAIEYYGIDKPDLRFGLKIDDITDDIDVSGFKVFEDAIKNNGRIKAIKLDSAEVTRKMIDKYTDIAKKAGAKGLVWFKKKNGELTSSILKFLNDKGVSIERRCEIKDNETVFIVVDESVVASEALGAVRLALRDDFSLVKDEDELKFLWVTEFPMFKYNEEEKRYETEHHPFTMPNLDDVERYIDSEPLKIRSKAYDLVLNGEEIASGSIRNHISSLQDKIFERISLSEEEKQEKFGFFVNALKYGTPPHGGIAPGIDRLLQILLKEESIRDVIAFPKTMKASCLMTESPSAVSEKQLEELKIIIKNV